MKKNGPMPRMKREDAVESCKQVLEQCRAGDVEELKRTENFKRKVALCFLAQHTPYKKHLWEAYRAHPGFRFYAHNDKYFTRYQQSQTRNHDTRQVRTSYADVSLVDAEAIVLDNAYRETDNDVFVIVSDTHIPLLTPECAYNRFCSIVNTEKIPGLVAVVTSQNNLKTYLAPFVDSESRNILEAVAVDHYQIPMQRDTGFTPILQWKLLSRRGAQEFIAMSKDVAFMTLFERQHHLVDPTAKMHTDGNDILLPFSAPDEGTFLLWCNHRAYKTGEEYVLVEMNFTVADFGNRKPFTSIPDVHNGFGIEFFCDAEALLARKVSERTKLAMVHGSICDCGRIRTYQDIEVEQSKTKRWSQYLPHFTIAQKTLECTAQETDVRGRCLPHCEEGFSRPDTSDKCIRKQRHR